MRMLCRSCANLVSDGLTAERRREASRLLGVKLFVGVVLMAASGCGASSRMMLSCREEVVALTHPTLEVVVSQSLIVDGRASLAVCKEDLPQLTSTRRAALEQELEAIVREEGRRMAPICDPKGFA